MDNTGERMLPEASDGATFWEHIHRYRLAVRQVRGKEVLDIACGEGYGTAALRSASGQAVLGVDISEEACAHAAAKYGVATRVGSALEIPCESRSRDVVVSFETIEHLTDPARFISEIRRVLRPDGSLIVSTPDRDVYREMTPANAHHLSELTAVEFTRLLRANFRAVDLFVQRPWRVRWWSPFQLAADDSPLFRLRGSYRLVRLLRHILCPHVVRQDAAGHRRDPVATILSPWIRDGALVNPYAVVRQGAAWGVTPVYLVALCRV